MPTFAQAVNTEFGKNRVQFHDDFKNWWRYETENFISYWYGKGRNVAQSVVQMAELDHDEIQNIMEHRFNEKIEIIVYIDQTDLKQSNIGLDDTFINRPKETKTEGNKMFVYFNGDHKHLRLQIRQGISSIYLSSILFGTNLQEIVQNAVLLNLPEWYQVGLISYIGSHWNIETDDELRDLLASNEDKYYDYEKLAADYPRIAGHSLWYFLDQKYGKSSISNILYLTKINKHLKSSFIYVLGHNYESLIEEWTDYYSAKYQLEEDQFDDSGLLMNLKNKNHQPISKLRLSPDGRYLAYVVNDIGKNKIYIHDFASETNDKIFEYGYRNSIQEPDYNYPIIEWHPRKSEITILYENRDQIKIRRLYLSDMTYEEDDIPIKIQRIYSLTYFDDTDYILSASDNGFSDLFLYKSETRAFDKLTDDYHDDLDATVCRINNRKGILFSSTRGGNLIEVEKLDTILPLDNFDIFFLPFGEKSAQRLTFTPDENERYPYLISTNHISFINGRSGIKNRYVKNLESDNNGYNHSNYPRNIIRHHSSTNQDLSIVHYYKDGAYQTYLESVDVHDEREVYVTPFIVGVTKEISRPQETKTEKPKEELKEEYLFVSDFPDPENIEPIRTSEDNTIGLPILNLAGLENNTKRVVKFNFAKAIASRKRFRISNLASRMSNEMFYEGIESYQGELRVMQELGILFEGSVKDLFEDYEIHLGARFPTAFDGSEFFVEFENNKYRIDKKYVLYRKSTTEVFNVNTFPLPRAKNVSIMGMVQYKYPFNIYKSLSVAFKVRNDRFIFSSTDAVTFELPVNDQKWVSMRLEYIYDNTINIDENILNGTRYKFYAEASNKFILDIADGFEFDASTGYTNVFGVDYRRYFPLGKYSVFAFRATGATSFGSDKMIYFLGGVENEFFGSFDNNTPLPQTGNFAYKAAAPHLRGFDQNIRNGSSYVLANMELRLPVVRYLFGNVSNGFFRNFQLTGFVDAGTAWHGRSPYSDENPLNSVNLESPPTIKVFVNYFRDPLVLGYGAGVRSSLFGYYIKLDFAYGVETRNILSPKLHFSIGNDF